MELVNVPDESEAHAFDKGYWLGYIHALEQMVLALTEGDETGLHMLDPESQAERLGVIIKRVREETGHEHQ
jgi:hypothetical protein